MQESHTYNPIEAKNRTICIWDIPLNTNINEIRLALTKYGEIKNLKMNTTGIWQSANIKFSKQEDYNKIINLWTIPFKTDLIRIFLYMRTNEIKQDHDQYTLKLTNLSPGTTGYDLKNIIDICKAHTCYIPR